MKKNRPFLRCFLSCASWLIVAWGEPYVSVWLSLLSATMGISLFLFAVLPSQSKKSRFVYGTLWYLSVQSVQLFWIATPTYQGLFVYFLYLVAILFIGLPFGLWLLCFPSSLPLSLLTILSLASVWTLIEWARLFLFCGFSLTHLGIGLAAHPIFVQMATLFGIYGLSFLTVVFNLLALNILVSWQKKWITYWGVAIFCTFLWGWGQIKYHDKRAKKHSQKIKAALVQTSLFPDQYHIFIDRQKEWIPPLTQWQYMLEHIESLEEKTRLDFIVFPESILSFQARECVYDYADVQTILKKTCGTSSESTHNLLTPPYAMRRGGKWYINHLFWSQFIANHYRAEVIIGLEEREARSSRFYASAFHFVPTSFHIERYDKRILLPIAEYLPFESLQPLAARYGISNFFTPGKEGKVFHGICPFSLSICYEECVNYLARKERKRGAQLFINITNDGWFPNSALPRQHFYHGYLRCVENGVPLLRSCNTGITAGVDSLGRVVATFHAREADCERQRGALLVDLNLYSYKTLYTLWGNGGVILLSISCIVIALAHKRISAKIKTRPLRILH